MHIPKFNDIQLELIVKANAVYLATPKEVADDISDTMIRAAALIKGLKDALVEIRSSGTIEVNGVPNMDNIAMKADEALLLIRQYSS